MSLHLHSMFRQCSTRLQRTSPYPHSMFRQCSTCLQWTSPYPHSMFHQCSTYLQWECYLLLHLFRPLRTYRLHSWSLPSSIDRPLPWRHPLLTHRRYSPIRRSSTTLRSGRRTMRHQLPQCHLTWNDLQLPSCRQSLICLPSQPFLPTTGRLIHRWLQRPQCRCRNWTVNLSILRPKYRVLARYVRIGES
jgi:hypothetical protein